MNRITVLGEVVVDRFHTSANYVDVAGGSAANCALALTRAGNEVKFKARFSDDPNGQFLFNNAKANQLDLSESIRTSDPATVVNIKIDDQGVPNYEFLMDGTADWNWSTDELIKQNLADQDALVYGSLVAILPPGYLAIQEWISNNRHENLLIAYDPNARPSALSESDHEVFRERIISLVESSDVVKVSDEDLSWIAPGQDPMLIASQWSKAGPALIVLTLGENGACAFRNGVCIAQVPGFKVNVVDTVGAGDTLMAWLVSGLLNSAPKNRFSASNVEELLRLAVKAAAITCSRSGCNPPTPDEVI